MTGSGTWVAVVTDGADLMLLGVEITCSVGLPCCRSLRKDRGVRSLLVTVLLGKTNGSIIEWQFLPQANLIVLCKSLSVGLV